MNLTCPSCNSPGMEVFHEVRGVPAHSCLMMDSRPAALAYPRGNMALSFCARCGLISNVLYDEGTKEYCSRYEDQQSFSPRFRAFQTHLVNQLIERQGIRGKDVLEIGCGKGDFLVELCRKGRNRGIGIDPACIPGRVAGGQDVWFIADYYGDRYANVPCDVICCRHTLEHIPQTGEFLRTVRRTVGDRPDVLVFFEVPDVRRVLRERAFWDIYYEHCSYFSLGSLARLFRASGFDVIELSTDFDDQYLLLTARPTSQATEPNLPEEHDLAALDSEVRCFGRSVGERIEHWRQCLERGKRAGRVAIWGSGSKCVAFLSTVGLQDPVDAIVDINPHRHGRFLAGLGYEVRPPQVLRQVRPHTVVLMNPIYREEIEEQLREMGVEAEMVAV